MTTYCFTPVLGKRIRVTSLDACGNVPASGTADSIAVSDGFISVNMSSEVEDGTEIITKKADGTLCVNEMTDPSFKRLKMDIEFCGVDPGLLALMTNANIYNDYASDTIGISVPEGTIDTRFAFELWTGLSGAACATGGDVAAGYLLLPFVAAGVIGNVQVDGANAVTFSMTGSFTKSGNAWGVGPYNVMYNGAVASPLPTALSTSDHLLMIQTGLALPASVCGLQAMP